METVKEKVLKYLDVIEEQARFVKVNHETSSDSNKEFAKEVLGAVEKIERYSEYIKDELS